MKDMCFNPLVSVIVPIYNVEKYLEECIDSILCQTYRNLEIILVDDGSNDKCPEICDCYANGDIRIKVIHKENGGIDSARKAGIMAAAGKYVGYVDGDDWIEPIMYEKLVEYAYRYGVDVVESGVIDSWSNREKRRLAYLKQGCYKGEDFVEKVEPKLLYSGDFYEFGISPYLWSKLFLKDKLLKYQMMNSLTNVVYNDMMVSLPCIAELKSLYISNDCYYHYRVRAGSLKRTCSQNEKTNLLKCYRDFYKRFEGTVLCTKEDKQIKHFAMYWMLFKAPYVFDNMCEDNFLLAYGNPKVKSKFVLYGAGAASIQLENYIRNVRKANIVCWADYNYESLQGTLDVRNPKEIMNCEYDYIIIAILRESAVQSAKKDLVELGVPEDKILWIEQKYIDNPEILLNKMLQESQL